MLLRRISQILFFVFFLYLLVNTVYPLSPYTPVKFFLQMDPLSVIAVSLSEKVFWILLFTIPTLLLAWLLGRVFCGWICPMGTLCDGLDKVLTPRDRIKNNAETGRPSKSRLSGLFHPRTKYVLILVFAIAAIMGAQWFWVLDPIPLVTRLASTVILPYFEWTVRTVADGLYEVPVANKISEPIYQFMRSHGIVSFQQPSFKYHTISFLILVAVALLSLLGRRTWCRTLCPLGALLSLFSKLSPARINRDENCIHCKKCAQVCKMGAIASQPGEQEKYLPSQDPKECIVCTACWNICPVDALHFQWGNRQAARPSKANLGRRHAVGAVATGLILAPLALLRTRTGLSTTVAVIRPPGALEEEDFLNTCIRCGECMKVCPQNALHPILFESGPGGIFTPALVPRLGYCGYRCTLCGQVCPTGAIKKLGLSEKQRTSLGLAQFVKDRCLPHAQSVDCLVCEEHCPTPEKAIQFRTEEVFIPHLNESREIKKPYVVAERCIGCGNCEHVCPLEGKAGVKVYPHSEQVSTCGRGAPPLVPVLDQKRKRISRELPWKQKLPDKLPQPNQTDPYGSVY